MATWDDVARIALALPQATEEPLHGRRSWRIRGRLFVWERPLGRSDLAALGERAPEGPIIGARVPDESARRALIASGPDVYFTIPHFDGYSAVLARLDRIPIDELEELIVEAWLLRAPLRLGREYAAARGLS
jgi:hypothetical protein